MKESIKRQKIYNHIAGRLKKAHPQSTWHTHSASIWLTFTPDYNEWMNDRTLSPNADHHDINRIKNGCLIRRNHWRPGRGSAFAGIENAFAREIKSTFADAGSMLPLQQRYKAFAGRDKRCPGRNWGMIEARTYIDAPLKVNLSCQEWNGIGSESHLIKCYDWSM